MPDMYAVWHPQTVQQQQAHICQLQNTELQSFDFTFFNTRRAEAVRENDREKWASISLYKAPRFIPRSLCKTLQAKRTAGKGKLYLVFCQLKTEG